VLQPAPFARRPFADEGSAAIDGNRSRLRTGRLAFGDQWIVLEEMGRALLCAPYFPTAVLAAGAIMNAGTEAEKKALLPGVAAGETTATFAWVEDNGRWDAEGAALTATAESSRIVLDGHKNYVVDGHTADFIVVLARAPRGLSLFTVDGNAPGL